MNHHNDQRRGYSRIDALFVIAIVTLLVTLLPAIPVIRESARQQTCRSHLRQLGAALHTYHDRYSVFPPAATWGNEGLNLASLDTHVDPTPIHVTRQNWIQLVLPDLDQTGLATQFHPELPAASEANRQARQTSVPLLNCPSDLFNRPDNLYQMRLPDGSTAEFARGNYAINGGTEYTDDDFGNLSNPGPANVHYFFDEEAGEFYFLGSGVTGINRSSSIRDFRNGTSTFVALEEVRAGLSPIDTRGVWALGQVGASITWGHGVTGDDSGPNFSRSLLGGADDIVLGRELYQQLGREYIDGERMQACDHCNENTQATSRSKHPGGVFVLMMDGAVRFVSDHVDPSAWHVMHSRDCPPEVLANDLTKELKGWDAKSTSQSRKPTKPKSTSSVLEKLENSIGMQFVRIPAGEFTMGLADANLTLPFPDDAVAHQVRITVDFLLGVHEVTQQQYRSVMGTNPSWHTADGGGHDLIGGTETDSWPVENVSWNDAAEFCRRLSELPLEKSEGRSYRLPTEAEWERACRADRTDAIRRPSWSEALSTGEIGSNRPPKGVVLVPGPIGSHSPNAFGVFDLTGNVFEWTADYRRRDFYEHSPVEDPTGPMTGYLRVIRGWHWVATGRACRMYVAIEPWRGSRFVGFRVVCNQERS